MAIKFSETVRNARLDAIETAISTSAVLKLRTGAPPANVATADSGTELVIFALPSDWMAAASGGAKAKTGTWVNTGVAAGDAGHFRIYASDGTTAHIQGIVTGTTGGDMNLDNINIAIGQVVTISTFSLTDGNA